MAQQVTTTLIDDLDPTRTADETVKFGLDGKDLEIDLANANAEKLRKLLAPFVQAARRGKSNGSVRRSTNGSPLRSGSERERNQAIRAWAIKNDWAVSDRGRLPAEVIEAWANAGAPMNTIPSQRAPKPEPEFVAPDPVPAIPWNKLEDARKAEVKAWSASIGIEPKKWTRNAVARDEMSGYCQNNDEEGAKACTDRL